MAATREQGPPRRRLVVLIRVAAVVLAADVATKVAVVAWLSGRPHVRLFGGQVEVLSPSSVRERLVATAQGILERYAGPSGPGTGAGPGFTGTSTSIGTGEGPGSWSPSPRAG